MKKSINQQILDELKKLNNKIDVYLMAKMKDIEKPTVADSQYFTIKDDGRKTSEIMAECRSLFNIYSYYSDEQLDKDFPLVKSERKFKKVVEADEENKNKSADELNQEDQITLRERLLMEIQYFKENGSHLDIDNVTLCAGSRYSCGSVPDVFWDSDSREVYVLWTNPGHRDGRWRARSAVKN